MDSVVGLTAAAAARSLAGRLTIAARRAMGTRGVFNLALSGGSTASVLMKALVDTEIFWGRVNVYQVDERVAPDGDAARNATALIAELVEQVGLPPGRLHLMDVTAADLADAARRYAAALPAHLDVVHLGLGDDGHTASWPPGDAVLDATEDVAVVGPFNGHLRMTLTPQAVNRAAHRVFLVTGEAKVTMLGRLLAGGSGIPAGRVSPIDTIVYADRAALPAAD